MAAVPTQGASGGATGGASRAAFGKRGTLALVGFAVIAFVAFLYLTGQGGLSGSANNGRAHAAGTGLNGFVGLTRMLEADDVSVIRSRDRGALDTPGLLVLTPPSEVDGEELSGIVDRRRTIGPTMIIAPKWFAMPAQERAAKRGWVRLTGASGDWEIEIAGRTIEVAGETDRKSAARWEGLGREGTMPSEQTLSMVGSDSAPGAIAPLVTDAQGNILAGYLADDGSYLDGDLYLDPDSDDATAVYGVMLVAEPDLVNNWGLADRTRAAAARELVAIARQGTEESVRFDLTLNGLGGSRNLLTLAFEPPFLAATLTLLLALAIAMWRAFNRFGPSLRPAPDIAPGKSQLVANGAQVIGRSGRWHLLRDPYANLVATRAVRRLGLRETPGQSAEETLHERGEHDLANAITALRNARGRAETLRAARGLRASERTTQQ
ncbi:DUF4350 domain-containing protein [Citromicrobium bathyomarinum]|uniref:DUF4350 domain-containing protein n=1 Tax=Citromicrobium bathyomarinum TaxID=72174 RepID=UPI00315A5F61